jgi:hypothetical protein
MSSKVGDKMESRVNYYVIAVIFIGILFFILANALEPQIDEQLDLFELIFVLGAIATAVFSFVVGLRYWPSKIFSLAYLALGIGYTMTAIGSAMFTLFQMSGIENPYPYWPDIFFAAFYPFAVYHLRKNIQFIRGAQKPMLKKNQVMIMIVIPLGITLLYAYGAWVYDPGLGIFDLEKTRSTESFSNDGTIDLIPRIFTLPEPMHAHDFDFVKGYLTGLFFVAATSIVFTWTIIGAQVFRGSVLGLPWGLLLVGIGLNTIADISYYYTQIEGYDRSNAIISLWVLGYMLVCYALYLHKKQL